MAFEMTNTQQVELKIEPKNRLGKPAQLDGAPAWATDNSDVIALTPAADGLSCVVAAAGVVGTATVQVTADADLSDGVRPIIGTIEVNITAGEAQTIEIVPGPATEQV